MFESIPTVWSLLSSNPDCADFCHSLIFDSSRSQRLYSVGFLVGFLYCLEEKNSIDPNKFISCLDELDRYSSHYIFEDSIDCDDD